MASEPTPSPERAPTDYRQNRRKADKTLLLLVIAVLFFGGTGLIGLIWGLDDAVLGGLCLLGGVGLIVGLWVLLGLLQRVVED